MEEIFDDLFEIKNGIKGVGRDIIFQLIELMYFRKDQFIQNLIGICRECVCWLNHPHFFYCRNLRLNLKKQIIRHHYLEEMKDVEVNDTYLKFSSYLTDRKKSLFFNVLVKEMIFECTIVVKFHPDCLYPWICIGVLTPPQLDRVIKGCIGWSSDDGACVFLCSSWSQIRCSGKGTLVFKEGGIKDGDAVGAVINQMNNKNSLSGGKVNFIFRGKKIPHTITNIPLEGVYFGFSSFVSTFTLHITSLHKLRVPPSSVCDTNDTIRCVAYDFGGGFKHWSYNHRDEEGEKIPNIREYYEQEEEVELDDDENE